MARPTVSVVIPAYNADRWLHETLHSVLHQTFQDFEIVLVDDGSTDQTRQVVECCRDSRIHYVYQQNMGLSAARNAGIRASRGEYVALLDADDLFKRDKLSRQVAAFERQPDLGLVTCGFELIDEGGAHIGEEQHWRHHPTLDVQSLLFWNPLLPSTLLIRRSWFDRVGLFDETLQRYEDWEFALRLACGGCRMDYVREGLVSYRRHTTNMSTATHLVTVATEAATRFMTRLFERKDLPLHIRALQHKVYGNLYLDAAARAYGAGLGAQAKAWLETAVAYDAELTSGNPPKWLDALIGHALTALVSDRRNYVHTLAANLPRYRRARRWTVRHLTAQIDAVSAFRDHRDGHRGAARVSALRALTLDPTLVRNRGLLAIGLRPW